MKYLILSIFTVLSANSWALSPQEVAARIQQEFADLHSQVSQMKPDYQVAEYLNAKKFGDHEILWKLSDEPGGYDVIRIYREKSDGRDLDVSFYRGRHMVPGVLVIRRFVGPQGSGWRADTVNADNGEYVGYQGRTSPDLDARDRAILRRWKIKNFTTDVE